MTEPAVPPRRGLIHIDMHYLTEVIFEKKNERFFESRHSDGYFDYVWGVHPFADIAGKKSREIEIIRFSDRQQVIEGSSQALGLPRFLMPLNFLLSQVKLLFLLVGIARRNKVAVISATDPHYLGLLGLALKIICRRPLVVHVYANFDELYEATGALAMPRLLFFRWVERLVARIVLSNADLAIAPNENNMRFCVNNGARRLRAVISNAKYVEDEHLRPPEEREAPEETMRRLGIPIGPPLMLCVGRLVALKHSDDAVRAMAEVINRRPDAVGLMAGRGPMEPEIEALIDDLGMRGRILMLGFVNQQDLSVILPRTVTVSPLTGMALIESGLAGSPVVAYDRDWQKDFVRDGDGGFVVPFGDHKAMGARILDILNDPALAARFSAAIRARARELADRDRIRDGERAAFDSVLDAWDRRKKKR